MEKTAELPIDGGMNGHISCIRDHISFPDDIADGFHAAEDTCGGRVDDTLLSIPSDIPRHTRVWYCRSVIDHAPERMAALGFDHGIGIETCGKTRTESYDVPVSMTDSEWNIGIPYGNGYCQVSLVSVIAGERRSLAVSGRVTLVDSYWLSHKEEMRESDALYGIYLSMLSSKEGELVPTATVREIISAFREADTDE